MSDKSIITENRSLQKSLARKKKARHVPLRSAGAKVEAKPTAVDIPENIASPVTLVDEPCQQTSTFATVLEISDDPSEGTDVPELVSPHSPTSSESSLQLLDGFSGDFAFAPPQYNLAPTADWKAPGMFRMPGIPDHRDEPTPTLCSTVGFNPTFSFDARQHLLQLAAATFESIIGSDEQTRFDLATAVWASASYTESSSTDNSLLTVEEPETFEGATTDEDIWMSESAICSTTPINGFVLLATAYPDIHTVAFGRPRDVITPKLIALGQATALAAYNAEAERSYAQAKADLNGVHLSIEDFDLDSDLGVTFMDETEVSDDDQIASPSSELSLASSVSGEDSSDQVWPLQEDDQIFLTCENGCCRVVGAIESSSHVKVPKEQDSDYESISSPTKRHLLLEGDSGPPEILLRSSDNSGEQSTSQGVGASVQAPLATDDSRFAAPATDDIVSLSPGASQDWLTVTVPATPRPVLDSEELTTGAGSQDPLTLTPYFIDLPSEMCDYSNIDQCPSLGRSHAGMVTQSPALDQSASRSLPSSSSSADDASTAEHEPATPGVITDWTVELVRVRLGTESLFTFLSLLDVDEEGSTTKVALITAFLTLVAVEREKLDLPSPPSSCTANFVLASKILPHTTVLGTTSLATFLAQFDSNKEGTVQAEEIYRVFKNLCKEEKRTHLLATTSIMGKIGRRLGKLSSA